MKTRGPIDAIPEQYQEHLRVLVCVMSSGEKVELEPTLHDLTIQNCDHTLDARVLVIEQTPAPIVSSLVNQTRRKHHPYFAMDYALLPNLSADMRLNRATGEARLQNADLVVLVREGTRLESDWLCTLCNTYRRTSAAIIAGPTGPPTLADNASWIEQQIHRRLERTEKRRSRLLTAYDNVQALTPSINNCLFEMKLIRSENFRFSSEPTGSLTYLVELAKKHDRRVCWETDVSVRLSSTTDALSVKGHYRHHRDRASLMHGRAGLATQLQSAICIIAGIVSLPLVPIRALLFTAASLGELVGSRRA